MKNKTDWTSPFWFDTIPPQFHRIFPFQAAILPGLAAAPRYARMTNIARFQSLVLPLALVASLLVIVIPLPASIMDVLLTINIAGSVLVLLTTLFVSSPLELSLFPTLLLAATIGRLVLNIATTRLILTQAGESGLEAAGGVVAGFGSFVAGNQIMVGLIIFSIIVLIQFIVVTKGASRISEVAARFALDGMPGRQMAIDAELNAGTIDATTAREQRLSLTRNAEFYGAMDGASKFVRGDAIAGIAITLINILGGLFIGVTQYGMSLPEAANVFTKLTIGDGLVSQLPAFLIALAAGLLVTRSAERVNLPVEFLRQMLCKPEALVIAATFLGILIFTRLPALPLLMVGGSFAGLALLVNRSPQWMAAENSAAAEPVLPPTRTERRIEDLLTIDPIELELGVGLLRLADPQRGGDLLSRITGLRQQVAVDLGTVLPRVRIRDNMNLEEYDYSFKIFGNVMDTGRVYPLRMLATWRQEANPPELDGLPSQHPLDDSDAWWIDPAERPSAERHGYVVESAIEILVNHLRQTIDRHAGELLTRDATKRLLDQLRETSPAVIDELVPNRMSTGQIQQVLRGLLDERISIRNLPLILESLCDGSFEDRPIWQLIEQVRRNLARPISAAFRNGNNQLHVVTLSAGWEHELLTAKDDDRSPTIEQIQELCHDTRSAISRLTAHGHPPVLLVPSALRYLVRQMTRLELPSLAILSYAEITSDTAVQSVEIVGEVKQVSS